MRRLPKFHDRVSLICGILVGVGLFADFNFREMTYGSVVEGLVGLVLIIHCADMLHYYRKHRIVKIVKTETERLVYKNTNMDCIKDRVQSYDRKTGRYILIDTSISGWKMIGTNRKPYKNVRQIYPTGIIVDELEAFS